MVVPFSAFEYSNEPQNGHMAGTFVLFLVFLSHFMNTRGKLTSVVVTLCCGYLILATWSPFEGYVVVD